MKVMRIPKEILNANDDLEFLLQTATCNCGFSEASRLKVHPLKGTPLSLLTSSALLSPACFQRMVPMDATIVHE